MLITIAFHWPVCIGRADDRNGYIFGVVMRSQASEQKILDTVQSDRDMCLGLFAPRRQSSRRHGVFRTPEQDLGNWDLR